MPTSILQRKTNIIFYQILGLGLGFWAGFMFLGIGLYPRLILIGRSLTNKLESICGCANHLVFFNHPFIFSFLILLGLGLTIFFGFIIIKTINLKKSTNKFIKAKLKNIEQSLDLKLKKTVRAMKLENEVIEINDETPSIFCFGFFVPKICISSGLVKNLDETELIAVLEHEQQHLLCYEPIKIFIIKTMTRVLFFVPGLKSLSTQYFTLSELAADGRATNEFKNKKSLARALYKLLELKERPFTGNNLAISFLSPTAERVNRLTNDNYVLKFKTLTPGLLFSFSFLIFSFVFLNNLIYSNQSMMMTPKSSQCLSAQVLADEKCQMLTEKQTCALSFFTRHSSCVDN